MAGRWWRAGLWRQALARPAALGVQELRSVSPTPLQRPARAASCGRAGLTRSHAAQKQTGRSHLSAGLDPVVPEAWKAEVKAARREIGWVDPDRE